MDINEKKIKLLQLKEELQTKYNQFKLSSFQECMDRTSELSNAIYRRIDWLGLKDTSLDFLCKIKEFVCNLFEEALDQASVEDSKARICEALEKCCNQEDVFGMLENWKELSSLLETIKESYVVEKLESEIKEHGQDMKINEMEAELSRCRKLSESTKQIISDQHHQIKDRLINEINELQKKVKEGRDRIEALETVNVTYNQIHQALEIDNSLKDQLISTLEKEVEKRNSQNQNLGQDLNAEKAKNQKMQKNHENAIEALKSKKEKENRELRTKNENLSSAIARIERKMLEKFENLEKDNMNLRVKISSLEEQSKSMARKLIFSEGFSFETIFLSTFRENFRILRSQVMTLTSNKGFKQFLELGDRDTSTKLLIEEFLARYSISFESLKSLYRFYKKSNDKIHEGLVVDAQSLKDISKCDHFMAFTELSTASEKIVQFMELQSSPCPSEKKFCTKCYKFSEHLAADCE